MDIRILLPTEPSAARRPSGADVEELLERMFAPPSVDAGQVPMHVYGRISSGEMRLALAILEDALRCALRHHDSWITDQRLAAHDAMEWIRSDDDSPPFSFVRVCQLFDLDPEWIRETLHRHQLRARQPKQAGDRQRCAA